MRKLCNVLKDYKKFVKFYYENNKDLLNLIDEFIIRAKKYDYYSKDLDYLSICRSVLHDEYNKLNIFKKNASISLNTYYKMRFNLLSISIKYVNYLIDEILYVK